MRYPEVVSATRPPVFKQSRCGISSSDLSEIVQQCSQYAADLHGGHLLITGATGWFGRWILDGLCALDDHLSLGLRITAVSRSPDSFCASYPRFRDESRICWIKSDVRHLHGLDTPFTHIVHAAAESTGHGACGPNILFDTLVDGTRNILRAAERGCRSFLYVSSGAVYGRLPRGTEKFSESTFGYLDCADPRSEYAEGKRAAEQLTVLASSRGIPARIVRCFAFVGPHMPFDRHFALGNFIADAVHGREIVIKSDGRAARSYLYMTDLLQGMLAILSGGTAGRAYNLGSPRAISIKDLAVLVNTVLGGAGVVIEGKPSAADRYVPDIDLLESEIGFAARVPLEQAIARTADWYREYMVAANGSESLLGDQR